jgi:putative flippase GtrA
MMPSRKVSVGALAGGLTIVGVWLLKVWKPTLEVPNEVAQGITIIFSAIVSFIVPDAVEEA